MRQLIVSSLACSWLLIVAFAVVLGTAHVLEAVGDTHGAVVSRYIALAVGIFWLVNQIVLVSLLSLSHLMAWRESEILPEESLRQSPEELGLSGEPNDESSIPPR